MRPLGLLAVVLSAWTLTAAPGRAAETIVSERPESVALTIYQDPTAEGMNLDARVLPVDYRGSMGLVLVSEWRTVDVPAGETRISFRGVADGIVPQTATLDGLPARFIESNQDYDLLSPGSLVRRSVGTKVQRITTNPVTGRETVEDAIIRSGPQGVMLEVGGRFEAIDCGGPPQRLVFPRPPEGLSDRPTLSLLLNVEKAGRYRVRLSYLATGVLWRVRYVMILSPQADRLDLTGWITLINTSRTSFVDAPTQVVAGRVERSAQTAATVVFAEALEPRCWPMDTTTRGNEDSGGVAPMASPPMMDGTVESVIVTARRREESLQDSPIAVSAFQSELGDYKLYSLPSPTTVAARQTKQVLMLARSSVKARWVYVLGASPEDDYDSDDDPRSATAAVKAVNSTANGLGVPLPGGEVSFLQIGEDDHALLVGNGRMWTAPVGFPLEIELDEDPDIQVRPVTLRSWEKGDLTVRRNRIDIRNAKGQPIVFEYRLRADGQEAFRVTAASRRGRKTPDGTVWTLTVPAGGTASFTYTVESEY